MDKSKCWKNVDIVSNKKLDPKDFHLLKLSYQSQLTIMRTLCASADLLYCTSLLQFTTVHVGFLVGLIKYLWSFS